MYDRRYLPLATLALILLSACLTGVSSQGLMGGFKGHHHRGTGAVELLLATGILAKLLNHRAKHGPSYAGRNILHAILGPRYPPRYTARFPLEAHQNLLQDDLIEPHASMTLPFQDELMLNQESALLAAKAPFLFNPGLPVMADSQMVAEAQLSQQLLAARRARKILEARKILAAQEAKNILAVQREAAHLLAAQEAAQTATLLGNPSRQILTSAPPPRTMGNQINQMNHQINQMNHQLNQMNGVQGQNDMMMGSERSINSRSDAKLFSLPAGLSEQEVAQIIANLANREK